MIKPNRALGWISKMKPLTEYFCLHLLVFSFICILDTCNSIDSLSTTQSVKDGQTIISSDGSFELGFFSPGSSENRYVGIWYKKKISTRTVVWVANRENPLTNNLGVLRVVIPGIIHLLNDTGGIVWTTNTTRSVQNPVARLLDSGNLVVKDVNDVKPDSFLWQSFDYPTDTLLPGMKMGRNLLTGLETYLSSWRNNEDPAPGDYTYHFDPSGFPQNILKKGQVKMFRFPEVFLQNVTGPPIYANGFVLNKTEVYYTYGLYSWSPVSRLTLSPSGFVQRWNWDNQTQRWAIYLTKPADTCDSYNLCGAYASCVIEKSPVCECLDKFVPENKEAWAAADWSSGCVRSAPLDCLKGNGFLKYSGIKLPDTQYSWFNRTMSQEECMTTCLNNCSCTAYANLEPTRARGGCLNWYGDLVDISENAGEEDIYIRMPASEFDYDRRGKKRGVLIYSILAGIILLGLSVMLLIWWWTKKKKRAGKVARHSMKIFKNESHDEEVELPRFDLSTIRKATNNFAIANKLGQGGFGPVYKGVLDEGEEIAVKRLSKTSMQGLNELKNEIHCIAKLQHRNLVKILGCCILGEERMVIYEYMPNKSLDSFIFDQTQREVLDWPKRFHIINGIARGLVYLHHDSRLRIIHRDLKASNILLDSDMNPKISDFGMAKIFAGSEAGANTNHVAGTYGYMSPEYAVSGLFSVKSDVFSFGVLVLEIVSGQRNSGFYHEGYYQNLLGYAWMLFKDGRSKELVDPNLADFFNLTEVLRCIQVALLCVQQLPEDRPNISSVHLMLCNEGVLPQPKQPGFFIARNLPDNEGSPPCMQTPNSVNRLTITQLQAR